MKIHTKKCIHASVEGYGRTQENKGENSLNPGMYENSKMINNICLEIEIKKKLKKKKKPNNNNNTSYSWSAWESIKKYTTNRHIKIDIVAW